MNKHLTVTAYVAEVVGFPAGGYLFGRQRWFAVITPGRVEQGLPGEPAAAVQIRYCELVTVPEAWFTLHKPISPGELQEIAEEMARGHYPASEECERVRPDSRRPRYTQRLLREGRGR